MRATAVLFYLLVPCLQAEPPKKPKDSSAVKVRWEIDLWEAYGRNEAAADAKYAGKTVELIARGKVRKGADGLYLIGCHATSPPVAGQTFAVRCHVRKEDVKKLASAERGDAFRIRGVCKGRFADRAARNGYYVRLDSCEVVALCVWKKDHYEDKK